MKIRTKIIAGVAAIVIGTPLIIFSVLALWMDHE